MSEDNYEDSKDWGFEGRIYSSLIRISVELAVANDLACYRMAAEGTITPKGANLPPTTVASEFLQLLRLSQLETMLNTVPKEIAKELRHRYMAKAGDVSSAMPEPDESG